MKTDKIGFRIKSLMKEREVSLDELSVMTKLTPEFLLALIDEDLYPSLGPLLKISRALGTRLGTLLDDQVTQEPVIVRKGVETKQLVTHHGADKPGELVFHSLGAGKSDRHMEPFFIQVFPESALNKNLSSHEGEEFIIVKSGAIEIIYGKETHVLSNGDSIYFNSVVPHYVSCVGPEAAEIYAVLYFPQ